MRSATCSSAGRAPTPAAPAVAFGSHLDTVPTGGRFDGVAGVLAGLEVLRALHDAGVITRAPLELVNWTNEEGSRFRPAMMGSRVAAGDLPLDAALAITDDDGVSVAQALADSGQAGPLMPAPRDWSAWLELHIEQGPVMEATGAEIGIVVGTMHARYFQLVVTGEPSHVGPTEMNRRHDSLAAAAEVILAVERIGLAAEPGGRASASWIENMPNARGNVPHITRLHCDVRHNSADARSRWRRRCARRCPISPRAAASASKSIPTRHLVRSCSTRSWARCCGDKAADRQLHTRDMIAAAGHDSVLMAPLVPSAMLFVPSVAGITHNPKEYSTKEQVARGAQVLLDAVLELAGV